MYPRDFWQHKDCASKSAEKKTVVELEEKKELVKVASVQNFCPVCEERKRKHRERVAKWRAKK